MSGLPSSCDGGGPLGDGRLDLTWTFRMAGETTKAWEWVSRGPPPLDQLEPVRLPKASNRHRHIPVTAYSMVNRGFVQLESGLEHDLLRKVDRDSTVRGMVSQPFRLCWKGYATGHHTPDLLTWRSDGSVAAWDARPPEKQDADFQSKVAVTAAACEAIGWRHLVFPGVGPIERINMLWLHGFRQRPEWADETELLIRSIISESRVTLRDVFGHDDGSGELITVVWHLIWCGSLAVDMNSTWSLDTPIACS